MRQRNSAHMNLICFGNLLSYVFIILLTFNKKYEYIVSLYSSLLFSGKHSPDDEFGCSCGRALPSPTSSNTSNSFHERRKGISAGPSGAAGHFHAPVSRRPSPLVHPFLTSPTSTSKAIHTAATLSNCSLTPRGQPSGPVHGVSPVSGASAALHVHLQHPSPPSRRYPSQFLGQSLSGSSPATRSHSPVRSPTSRPALLHRLSAHASPSSAHLQKASPYPPAPLLSASSSMSSTLHMTTRGTARERVRRTFTERVAAGPTLKARRALKHLLMKAVTSSGSSASASASVSRSRLASSEAEPDADCDTVDDNLTVDEAGLGSCFSVNGWSRDGSVERCKRSSSAASTVRRRISAERGWLHTLGRGRQSLRRSQSSHAKDSNSSSRWSCKHVNDQHEDENGGTRILITQN